MRFGTDGDGNYGYYGADGSLIPFKSGMNKLATGTFTISNNGGGNVGVTINLGFKPDFLVFMGTDARISLYDSDYSTTRYRWKDGISGASFTDTNFGANKRSGLYSINENGFTTMGSYDKYKELYYACKYS